MVSVLAFNRHEGRKGQASKGGGNAAFGGDLGIVGSGQPQTNALGWQVSHDSSAVGSGHLLVWDIIWLVWSLSYWAELEGLFFLTVPGACGTVDLGISEARKPREDRRRNSWIERNAQRDGGRRIGSPLFPAGVSAGAVVMTRCPCWRAKGWTS